MSIETFSLDFVVRDYEVDLQGVVNNANYMHYLEHARHEYIKAAGVDFAALHTRSIDPLVIRAELDFRVPLVSGDAFSVLVEAKLEGRMRLDFMQTIVRSDGTKVLDAVIRAAVLVNGRPTPFDRAFGEDDLRRLLRS